MEPSSPRDSQVLARVEPVRDDVDVLVPQKDVIVRLHHVRVEEPLGEPPLALLLGGDVDRVFAPRQVVPAVYGAVVVEEHDGELVEVEGPDDGVHSGFLFHPDGEDEEVALGVVRVVRGVAPEAPRSKVGGSRPDPRGHEFWGSRRPLRSTGAARPRRTSPATPDSWPRRCGPRGR